MAGAALQLWPNRLVAGAFISDVGAVFVSLGNVRGCVRNAAGDYTIEFANFAEIGSRPPMIFATAISSTAARIVTASAPDATHVRVLVFDAAGVAADNNFCVFLMSSERLGAAP